MKKFKNYCNYFLLKAFTAYASTFPVFIVFSFIFYLLSLLTTVIKPLNENSSYYFFKDHAIFSALCLIFFRYLYILLGVVIQFLLNKLYYKYKKLHNREVQLELEYSHFMFKIKNPSLSLLVNKFPNHSLIKDWYKKKGETYKLITELNKNKDINRGELEKKIIYSLGELLDIRDKITKVVNENKE